MKEFRADTGGRYTYNEDVLNLQDLALAFNEIFADCENFVVSGCVVSGQTVSPGYVYLNRKLRYFPGAAGISQWPQYIYEVNYTENTAYASGGTKIARTVYGCQISSQQPTTPDPVTNQLPGVLTLNAAGGLGLKDAFIGKHAVLANPNVAYQTINKPVNFNDNINVGGNITSVGGFKTSGNAANGRVYYSGETLIIESKNGSNTYQIQIPSSGGFKFYVNDALCLTVNQTGGIVCGVPLHGGQATFSGLGISGDNIYQASAAGEGTLYINSVSHNGTHNYARNTVIGDGRGSAVLTITGASKTVTTHGALRIEPSVSAIGLLLKANKNKSSIDMQSYIAWQDNANNPTASVGFNTSTDNAFRITNYVAGIQILGADSVNIGPSIQENGTLLSDKYVLTSAYTTAMNGKADKGDVYTKKEVDDTFVTKEAAFTQFLTNTTALDLRNQIEAASIQDLSTCARITNYLSDMATSETAKAQIRRNIGACSVDDVRMNQSDSGWIQAPGASDLYVRQIGNIVCIQGTITLKHSGQVFSIPNTLDCPNHGLVFSLALENNKSWSCEIAPHQRSCTVKYCNGSCGLRSYFSLTYMV